MTAGHGEGHAQRTCALEDGPASAPHPDSPRVVFRKSAGEWLYRLYIRGRPRCCVSHDREQRRADDARYPGLGNQNAEATGNVLGGRVNLVDVQRYGRELKKS